MHQDIERGLMPPSGKHLFTPSKLQEVRCEWQLPDKARPPANTSAPLLPDGRPLSEDPFVLLPGFGRQRSQLLADRLCSAANCWCHRAASSQAAAQTAAKAEAKAEAKGPLQLEARARPSPGAR